MLRVVIDQKSRSFAGEITILQALRSIDVEVPTLCHDERLKAYGGCRLCMVEVQGWPRPVAACTTPLADGMVIETNNEELRRLRQTLLKLLARHYPAGAVQQFPDKPFHRYLREYGLEAACAGAFEPSLRDDSHPYIHVDMSQCIDCYRCARICEEVQGQRVWRLWNRGDRTVICPDSQTTLAKSSCVSCGACVDTCPTRALENKTELLNGSPDHWTRTTCPYCGTGCEMDVGTRQQKIIAVKPALEAPVNQGHLCVKGRYAFDFVYAKDRITEPMIRQGGRWQQVSWEEAIRFTAERLQRLVEQYGADSIGVLGSARATNEENYLTQKFARLVIGTNNVDCCARVCHGPTAAAMKEMLGTGAATNSFADIEKAQTILVCGCNPTENHPIVGARIKQAALKGAHLIVIDPRRIELARYADHHLQLTPGTNVPLLHAFAHTIVEERLYDESFLDERVANWPEFQDFIHQWPPERAAEICKVEAATICQAARLYANAKPAMSFHGLGMTEHRQGTEGVMGLVNLALLTGNLGKPGSGINPLRGQNNVQGAAHMGCEPNHLTGYVPLLEGKAVFESLWQAVLPKGAGLNLLQMMTAAEAGKLKALWAIGYDILFTNAQAHATRRALEAMELVIVQDMFFNETAKEFGTVFFPAASSFEKDGTFMNAERRVQRVRKVMDPSGEARADWQIICMLAEAMGKGECFAFNSAEEIWNEIRAVWQAGRGIDYQRLEQQGLQWPCPTEDHPGTEILHQDAFPVGPRASLRCVEYQPTPERTDEEFPFLLNSGRTLYHFNAGTMTLRTKDCELQKTDYLDISGEDARRMQLKDGQNVRVVSRYGEAIMPIRLTTAVKQGELFATFHDPQVFLNFVTGPHQDTYVKTPEYKVTAVRIAQL
jgi:formate dehydrogenase major subunit